MVTSSSRPLRQLGILLVVALLAGVGGWIVATQIQSPADAAATRSPPVPTPILAAVEQRPLTATVVTRGTIRYADTTGVSLAGPVGDGTITRQIVTQLPGQGDVIDNGTILAEVSGRPIIAMQGSTPRYRSTIRDAVGNDVRQLEDALLAAGFDPGEPDGKYTSRDQSAVTALYEALGYPPVKDGSVVWVPAGEIVFLPELPLQVASVDASVGDEASNVIMHLASSVVEISGSVSRADAASVTTGTKVIATVPELGRVIDCTISEIAATSGTDGVDPSRVHFLATPTDPAEVTDLIGSSVQIEIPVASTNQAVLVVPTSAVTEHPDGRITVTVVDEQGQGTVRKVEVGFSANGYVEIIPAGDVEAGDEVLVGYNNSAEP